MQVLGNTTGMQVGLSFTADKHGQELCVVVVKGTFVADPTGQLTLAPEQMPLVYADEHHGDPETTSVKYESEFAPEKPFAEVLVVGQAVAPGGVPVRELAVRLEVNGRSKDLRITGERQWARSFLGVVASDPLPFREMPITYDRAYGGTDASRGPGRADVETRNLHGVGHHPHHAAAELHGLSLPNVEHPYEPLKSPNGRAEPIGFGVLGRSYSQRARYAGTYDQHWLDEVFPFLPADFDTRYFMSSAEDQWFPPFRGGERIRCVNMASEAVVSYTLPAPHVPLTFQFRARSYPQEARLDTVIVEPHARRAQLIFRHAHRVVRRDGPLLGVLAGGAPAPGKSGGPAPMAYRNGKPHFRSLGDATAWLRTRRKR